MFASNLCARRALPLIALIALAGLAGGVALADPDIYDQAVAHPGRLADDLQRDAIDHPAEVLRLSGIKPGMQVGDLLAANGYYSELLSYVVGPSGHVLMLNNKAYDNWSLGWQKRLADNRLPNVEHKTVDLMHLDVPSKSLDAMVVVKVYHDLYWQPGGGSPWPTIDPNVVLGEVARVVKPGGILLLVDHSAKPGTGSSAASPLHRIDEKYARKDWEKHGFTFVTSSEVLRRPDDRRDQITFEGPMVGKTDRFVMVFKRN
jgi:predicted methyltransferase